MGDILVFKGADFSNYPGVVNIADLPNVRSSLLGFYTGKHSITDSGNLILEMPSVDIEGPTFKKIIGSTNSPLYPYQGTYFKGSVIRCGSSAVTPGLTSMMNLDIASGVSFSFLYWRSGSTVGPNRVLFGVKGIGLQFRSNSVAGTGHLQIGSTSYNIGFETGLTTSAVEAITITVNQNQVQLFRNGSPSPLGTLDVSGLGLPATIEDTVSLFGNWTGASGLSGHQIKQVYIHGKTLSTTEIASIHGNLSNLTV